jgi:N-glycosylase/DNA lyase
MRSSYKNAGVLECPEFDLRMTLESGQTFHWTEHEGGFTGCIGSEAVFVRQEGTLIHYLGPSEELIRHYFALDHDLALIRASCKGHAAAHEAAIACKGLRIMRQPHWECLATFILSPMKQVAHIRQMSLALRTTYGKRIPGTPVPSFPSAEALSLASESDLRKCGLGFRAKGLLGTAKLIAEGKFHPDSLVSMETDEARSALCTLPGIGRKVANCILLFAYERLEAVPVDVWIGRILGSFRSPKSRKVTPEQLEHYGERLLGPYAGYIQQYLFHQARTGKLKLPEKRHDGRVSSKRPKRQSAVKAVQKTAKQRKKPVAA